jgi:PAS domain S-box-containing protein
VRFALRLASVFPKSFCVRVIRLTLLLSLISLVHPWALAQAAQFGGQRVLQESWIFRDGAPEGITALAQTNDGFLWLGGPTGLFRFDGRHFERFHPSSGEELLSTTVTSISAPSTGGLWVGYTFGGFSFVNNGRVTNYGGEIAASTGSVADLTQAPDRTLWAATTSGLWRFHDSVWQHLGAEWNAPDGSAGYVELDRSGTLWVIARKKLLYLRPGSKQFRVADENLNAIGFTMDADGRVVTSQRAQQAPNSGDSEEQDFPVFRNHSSQVIDRNGSVWIVDSPPHSLTRIPSMEQLDHVSSKISTPNSEAYGIHPGIGAGLIDREGNVWYSDELGVYRLFYSPLMEQEIPSKLGGLAIAADDHGAIWIGPWKSNELYHVAQGKIDAHYNVPKVGGLQTGWSCAYRAPDKTFWFGGPAGIWHLVHRKLVPVEAPQGMMDQVRFLQAIAADRVGGLWFSFGRHGLYRLADGMWTPYGGRNDLPKTGVVTEFTDSPGRVWFGYMKSQLAVLDGDRVQVFGPSDGIQVGTITAIYGRGPEIWIGGEFGLQQFDHGRFHTIVAVDGDWLRGITGIAESANGDLWLNGLSGVFHIGRAEVAEAIKNSAYQVKGEHLGAREGLPGVAAQLRPLHTAIQGRDGRLWFAQPSGLVWLDPNRSITKLPPPPITIETVAADDKNYETAPSLTFPAHTSSVQINYAAVSLSDPEAIRFRYKLQETDAGWHEVSAASPVTYRNLLPGAYHFRVAASDTNGSWSNQVADLDFTIVPAWYQTGWFRGLFAAAFLGVLWALYQVRIEQVRRQERKLRDVIETIPTFAWTALPDGSVDFVNCHWQEYTGLSTEKTVGSGWETAAHPEDVKRYAEKWRAAVASGAPFENEVRFQRAVDAQYRWFLTRAVPLRDARGKILKWYGTSTDIEDRERAKQLQADLAHINRVTTMGELSASLAHELKQPIAATVMNANACFRWLKRDKPNLEEACAATSRIVKEQNRAAEMIDHLRSLYKKSPPKRELVEVNEVVHEMVVLLRGEANRYAVSMRTDLAAGLPRIMADRVQLQQVLMNLMLNAIEAMKETGGVLTVTSQHDGNPQLLLSVSDTGVGLPAEKADQIFDAFFTTKTQGSGMGLAISRSIVESHGGTLWAVDNLPRGAKFCFTLPTSDETHNSGVSGDRTAPADGLHGNDQGSL